MGIEKKYPSQECVECGYEISYTQYKQHSGLCKRCHIKTLKKKCDICSRKISELASMKYNGLCQSCHRVYEKVCSNCYYWDVISMPESEGGELVLSEWGSCRNKKKQELIIPKVQHYHKTHKWCGYFRHKPQ